jgi:hypothetical protein
MRKFEYKYKIDEEHRTVVAFSSFAGKVITGVAHCDPGDTFDVDIGKKLAAARCSVKIAEKRMKRAEKCYSIAVDAFNFWAKRLENMKKYDTDSVEGYKAAVSNLTVLEENFCK